MYIYIGKKDERYLFAVKGNTRFRIINLYENGIVESKHIEYNRKFTKVTVSLSNPKKLDFKEGNEYGIVIEKEGIECAWDKKAPKYTMWIPTPPTKDTILELGLNINKYDTYWSDSSDSKYSIPSPKQKKKIYLPKTIVISKYGEYETIFGN
jgi:hypothetical protein